MTRIIHVRILPMLLVLLVAGCASTGPRSFSKKKTPSWEAIRIRDELEYDRAWDTVVEILVKNFDLEMALREEGYIRTGWLHTWSGEYLSQYRVRATIKFSPDRTRLQFRSEAHLLEPAQDWIVGTDVRLLTTLRTDITSTVGNLP